MDLLDHPTQRAFRGKDSVQRPGRGPDLRRCLITRGLAAGTRLPGLRFCCLRGLHRRGLTATGLRLPHRITVGGHLTLGNAQGAGVAAHRRGDLGQRRGGPADPASQRAREFRVGAGRLPGPVRVRPDLRGHRAGRPGQIRDLAGVPVQGIRERIQYAWIATGHH